MAQGHPWKSRVLGLSLVAGLALTGAGCLHEEESASTATPGPTVAATATADTQNTALQGGADVAVTTPTIQIPALNLEGTVLEVADGAVLVDVDGQWLLLPDTLTFQVDGQDVAFADLDVDTDFTVGVPATSGNVVALLPDALVVDTDTYGTLMVPSSMIPNNVLAQTKVPVRLGNGNEVTVPLTAAMNMVRSQGAQIVVDEATLQTLASGTNGHALFLGKLEDGNMLVLSGSGGQLQLAQFEGDFEGDLEVGTPIAFTWDGENLNLVGWGGDLDGQEIELSVKRGDSDAAGRMDDGSGNVDGDESADLHEGQGQDSAPGQEIAPANPSTPPGLEEEPGRGPEDAPGQSIAPGQQDDGDDTTSDLNQGSDDTTGGNGNGNAGGNGNGYGKGQGGGND